MAEIPLSLAEKTFILHGVDVSRNNSIESRCLWKKKKKNSDETVSLIYRVISEPMEEEGANIVHSK